MANKKEEPKVTIDDKSLDQFGPLELEDFLDYMTSDKKAAFIVLFTAKDKRGCRKLDYISEEFQAVAVSYKRSSQYQQYNLFFGTVDFNEVADFVEKVHLKNAPAIVHYPPNGKLEKIDYMDMKSKEIRAALIAKWIEERTKIKVKILPPSLFFEPRRFFRVLRDRCVATLSSSTLIGTLAVVFCYEMSSGIISASRERDLYGQTAEGPDFILTESFSRQYPIESYIIIALYCCFAASFNLLIRGAAKTNKDAEIKIKCFLALMAVLVFFSLIIAIFRLKLNGYPFRLFF